MLQKCVEITNSTKLYTLSVRYELFGCNYLDRTSRNHNCCESSTMKTTARTDNAPPMLLADDLCGFALLCLTLLREAIPMGCTIKVVADKVNLFYKSRHRNLIYCITALSNSCHCPMFIGSL